MPHPPLSDKRGENEEIQEEVIKESNESEKYIEGGELNNSSIELTPNVPTAEVEIIADDSLDEPEVVINDEVEIIDNIPQEQIPIEQPNNDLGTRIGGEEKEQNVDLGVQLF